MSGIIYTIINQTGQAIESLLVLLAVFLTISLSVSLFMNWYNARVDFGDEMTDHVTYPNVAPRDPPKGQRRPLWKLLFGDITSASLTLIATLIIIALLPAINWGIVDANWTVSDPSQCREGGACWAFIRAKSRLILFGLYPPEEQWRPMIVIGMILAMVLASLSPRVWGPRILLLWAVAIVVMLIVHAWWCPGARIPAHNPSGAASR